MKNTKAKNPKRGALLSAPPLFDIVKTGVQIREDVSAIIKSGSANLAEKLTSYIIRTRNESLRASNNPAWRVNHAQQGLNRRRKRALPVLKTNANILPLRDVANRVKQTAVPVKRAGKNVAKLDVSGVIKRKHDVVTVRVRSNKTPDVGCCNNANLHKRVATVSNDPGEAQRP
jgi:hypothetical protein